MPLETCRSLLGFAAKGRSDAEVLRLRDQLYDLADFAVSAYERHGNTKPQIDALKGLPSGDRIEVEERAAILEFDALMTRRDATRVALATVSDRRREGSREH